MLLFGQMAKVRSPRWFACSFIFTFKSMIALLRYLFISFTRSKSAKKINQRHNQGHTDKVQITQWLNIIIYQSQDQNQDHTITTTQAVVELDLHLDKRTRHVASGNCSTCKPVQESTHTCFDLHFNLCNFCGDLGIMWVRVAFCLLIFWLWFHLTFHLPRGDAHPQRKRHLL